MLLAEVARLGGTRDGADPLPQLALASDEEMFRFIDSQL
jgi:hypothetical protein